MITLGIDLASQPKDTAACVVAWRDGGAEVVSIELDLTDRAILVLASECDVVAIDAPFGWPLPFIDLVSHDPRARRTLPDWIDDHRDRLLFRRTDVVVWKAHRQRPLSVSSDRIAFAAMRCAGLLDALGVVDRSGDGRIFEVYPAVALKVWGFETKGYKKTSEGEPRRRSMIERLQAGCEGLRLTDDVIAWCVRSDDAFDRWSPRWLLAQPRWK